MKRISLLASALVLALLIVSVALPTVFAEGPNASPTPVGTQKAARIENARTVGMKIFDNHFLDRLNALRAKISANEKFSAEVKQALQAKVDAEIMWFTNKKSELTTATAIPQIRTIVKDARARFQNFAKEMRLLYIARGLVVSLEKVITNLENNIIAKIDNKLTQFSNNGVDVSAERLVVGKAKSEIADAKSELALTKISVTFEDAKKHFEAAKGHVKAARQFLKEALQSLKNKV